MAKYYQQMDEINLQENIWGSSNSALDHENGKLTDMAIQKLPDQVLYEIAYCKFDKRINSKNGKTVFMGGDFIRTEKYRCKQESPGRKIGEIYMGVHRAMLELKRRDEIKKAREIELEAIAQSENRPTNNFRDIGEILKKYKGNLI